MGACLFVATGLKLRVDEYLAKSPFHPLRVFRKGEVPPKDPQHRPRSESGFASLVSDDREEGLARQFDEAMKFLARHERELIRLKDFGADTLLFDFGHTPPDQSQSSVYLPSGLISAMARFNMGLSFSVVKKP